MYYDAVAASVPYYNLLLFFSADQGHLITARGTEQSLRDMDVETLKFDSTKMVTTWWDVVDHYLLAVMFAVSLASVGLQTTQDRLICLPAVNCSNFERNDSVVRKWDELSNILDICNRSPSYVVLTKMPDRRQYDYIDNECYKKIHWFSSYYSLIFLVEVVILLAISNFWQKCPDLANALAQCEHLLSEIISGDFKDDEDATVRPGEGGEQGRYDREEQEAELAQFEHLPPEMTSREQETLKKLKVFKDRFGQKIIKFNLSSLTLQYRLRGVVGFIFAIAFLAFNVGCYFHSTGWTQCHLNGHIAFSTEHRVFQCTRSKETYFYVSLIVLIAFLFSHLVFVFGSFLWSVTGTRRGPEYILPRFVSDKVVYETFRIHGDAALLLHFIDVSKCSTFIRQLQKRSKEEKRMRKRQQQRIIYL